MPGRQEADPHVDGSCEHGRTPIGAVSRVLVPFGNGGDVLGQKSTHRLVSGAQARENLLCARAIGPNRLCLGDLFILRDEGWVRSRAGKRSLNYTNDWRRRFRGQENGVGKCPSDITQKTVHLPFLPRGLLAMDAEIELLERREVW